MGYLRGKNAWVESSERHNPHEKLVLSPEGTTFEAAQKLRWVNRPAKQGDAAHSVADIGRIGEVVEIQYSSTSGYSFYGAIRTMKHNGTVTLIHHGTIRSVSVGGGRP